MKEWRGRPIRHLLQTDSITFGPYLRRALSPCAVVMSKEDMVKGKGEREGMGRLRERSVKGKMRLGGSKSRVSFRREKGEKGIVKGDLIMNRLRWSI